MFALWRRPGLADFTASGIGRTVIWMCKVNLHILGRGGVIICRNLLISS